MNTAHVSSFVMISILRGQPRTPPSGENLGVLDYHLKDTKQGSQLYATQYIEEQHWDDGGVHLTYPTCFVFVFPYLWMHTLCVRSSFMEIQ